MLARFVAMINVRCGARRIRHWSEGPGSLYAPTTPSRWDLSLLGRSQARGARRARSRPKSKSRAPLRRQKPLGAELLALDAGADGCDPPHDAHRSSSHSARIGRRGDASSARLLERCALDRRGSLLRSLRCTLRSDTFRFGRWTRIRAAARPASTAHGSDLALADTAERLPNWPLPRTRCRAAR